MNRPLAGLIGILDEASVIDMIFPEMEQKRQIVLIGEAPGLNTTCKNPLFPWPVGSTGHNLCALMGVSSTEYLRTFRRANLLTEHPGTWANQARPKDKWPKREARTAAGAMRYMLEGHVAVFVGRRVAEAFGYGSADLPFCVWSYDEDWKFFLAAIPHTSGRNHWYSRPDNKAKASAFFKELIQELKRGLVFCSDVGEDTRDRGVMFAEETYTQDKLALMTRRELGDLYNAVAFFLGAKPLAMASTQRNAVARTWSILQALREYRETRE